MSQTALSYDAMEAQLFTGRVSGGEKGAWRVLAGNALYEASLAASCLLEPEINDIVLLAGLENGQSIILSVLFRAEGAQARLNLPQDSAISCPGRLALRAAAGLELESGQELNLKSESMNLAAKEASAQIAKASALLDTAQLCCRALTTFGHNALTVFHSLTQCLGRSQRLVEGADETRCAESTLVASENATVMSKNQLNLAEETARTDAKLIQMG